MSDDRTSDGWSRAVRFMREKQTGIADTILGGQCSHEQYLLLCGRYAELDEIVAKLQEIRTGADLRQAKREPLASVEC